MSGVVLGLSPLVTPVELLAEHSKVWALEVVSPWAQETWQEEMEGFLRQAVHRGQALGAEQPGQCIDNTGSVF